MITSVQSFKFCDAKKSITKELFFKTCGMKNQLPISIILISEIFLTFKFNNKLLRILQKNQKIAIPLFAIYLHIESDFFPFINI